MPHVATSNVNGPAKSIMLARSSTHSTSHTAIVMSWHSNESSLALLCAALLFLRHVHGRVLFARPHPMCRCTSGFKAMATMAIGGAVIGSVAALFTEGPAQDV